jgi:hypothetical protein
MWQKMVGGCFAKNYYWAQEFEHELCSVTDLFLARQLIQLLSKAVNPG